MNRNKRIFATIGVALLGCGAPTAELPPSPAPQVICTMEARPAITVEPVDARTGAPVIGATLIALSSTTADTASAQVGGSSTISAAYERAGTYTVTVTHPSYREWQRANVQVGRDECHVQTVRLKAELESR